MANTKNTIQNISLTGTLNLNTLQTDIRQFEGYNEKNTTLYGGTLSPIYAKEESLYSIKDSYTIYNADGVPLTLYSKSDGYVSLYKGLGSDSEIIESKGLVPFKREIITPSDDAIFAASIVVDEDTRTQFCIDKSDTSYIKYKKANGDTADTDIDTATWSNFVSIGFVPDCCALDYNYKTNKGLIVLAQLAVSNNNDTIQYRMNVEAFAFTISSSGEPSCSSWKIFSSEVLSTEYMESVPTISVDATNMVGYVCSKSGKITATDTVGVYKVYLDSDSKVTIEATTTFYNQSANYWVKPWPWYTDPREGFTYSTTLGTTGRYYDINQLAMRVNDIYKNNMADIVVGDTLAHTTYYHYLTGQNGDGFIPTMVTAPRRRPLTSYWYDEYSVVGILPYYLDGQLFSISAFGMPIAPTSNIDSSVISVINNYCLEMVGQISQYTDFYSVLTVNYKSNKKWYAFDFCKTTTIKMTDKSEVLKQMVVNDDTIWMPTIKLGGGISSGNFVQKGYGYSISNDTYNEINIGYISTEYPYYKYNGTLSDSVIDGITTTGAIFGGGYNAGYSVSGANNIGYLPNPSLMTYVPAKASMPITNSNTSSSIQLYCTLGNTVQSATYVGTDSRYYGTVISIDSNGNLPLPIPYGATVIAGYSNNDLVDIDGTIYPLIYYNNNQRINGFYLLSMLESMQGSFSLQGQSYVFDNDNIYSAVFDSGIVGSVTEVAYKRNLQFIGTLPTQAIFYSKFNKTFYAFTGDRVLSKMMEASYIDDIYYVGQNPSTLSVWICTDKGVYIISDDDMYRLNFIADSIDFAPSYAILSTDDGSYNKEIRVALYEVQDGMTEIPVTLSTEYYGLGTEIKANMDCWYIRVFQPNKKEGYVTIKVNTITDTTKEAEEKTFKIEPSNYDSNCTAYIRYQPKFQECVAMQLELESNLGIYEIALGINNSDSTTQISKFNF